MFLWTDKLFLATIFISCVVLTKSLRSAHYKTALKKLLLNKLALVSGVILAFFLSIATLDSIHLKNSHTLLDNIIGVKKLEKTYSAPLALNSYLKETTLKNGIKTQFYPHLKNIKVANAHERSVLIALVLLKSLALTILISLFLRLFSKNYTFILTLASLFFISLSCVWINNSLHLLGTGQIGQDTFYYAIKSIRTGLIIGLLTTLFMLPLALLCGLAAGYFGGITDDIIQYIYTTLSSIPGVLLISAAILSLQTYIASHPQLFDSLEQAADARLLILCIILGVTSWTSLCRVIRAESLKLREMDYVTAAKILHTPAYKILYRHLLPNLMHIVIITIVIDFSFLVLAEAVLSYIGVGVSPLTISWGNMINGARLELAREPIVWWPMLAAFIFMFFLVLASNVFADALRDALDPRQA